MYCQGFTILRQGDLLYTTLSMDSFSDWLRLQLKNRNWRQADLARAAHLDSAVISNLINERRGPGEDTCRAIARAFHLPPEQVFRAAGILPPSHNDIDEELEYLYSLLDESDKARIIDIMRAFIKLTGRGNHDVEGQDRLQLPRKA